MLASNEISEVNADVLPPEIQRYRDWIKNQSGCVSPEHSLPKGVSFVLAQLDPNSSLWPARICNEKEVEQSLSSDVIPRKPNLSLLVVFLSLNGHNFYFWVDPLYAKCITSFELVELRYSKFKVQHHRLNYYAAWAWAQRLAEIEVKARGNSMYLEEYWNGSLESRRFALTHYGSNSDLTSNSSNLSGNCHLLNKYAFNFEESVLVSPWRCIGCDMHTLVCDCSRGVKKTIEDCRKSHSYRNYLEFKCGDSECITCTQMPGLPILIAELGVQGQWAEVYNRIKNKIKRNEPNTFPPEQVAVPVPPKSVLHTDALESIKTAASVKTVKLRNTGNSMKRKYSTVSGVDKDHKGDDTADFHSQLCSLEYAVEFDVKESFDLLEGIGMYRKICADTLQSFISSLQSIAESNTKVELHQNSNLNALAIYLTASPVNLEEKYSYRNICKKSILEKFKAILYWFNCKEKESFCVPFQIALKTMTADLVYLVEDSGSSLRAIFERVLNALHHRIVRNISYVQVVNHGNISNLLNECVNQCNNHLNVSYDVDTMAVNTFKEVGHSGKNATENRTIKNELTFQINKSEPVLNLATIHDTYLCGSITLESVQKVVNSLLVGKIKKFLQASYCTNPRIIDSLRPVDALFKHGSAINSCIVALPKSVNSLTQCYSSGLVQVIRSQSRNIPKIAYLHASQNCRYVHDIALNINLDSNVVVVEVQSGTENSKIYSINPPKFEFEKRSVDWQVEIRQFKPDLVILSLDLRNRLDFNEITRRALELAEECCFGRFISVIEFWAHEVEVEFSDIFEELLREHLEILAHAAAICTTIRNERKDL